MQYYTIDDLRRSPTSPVGADGPWSGSARWRGAGQVPHAPRLRRPERRADGRPPRAGAGPSGGAVSGGVPCEDVQAASPEALPLWADRPEAIAAAKATISALHLRYRISGRMAVPVPPAGKPRWELRDKYLWLSGESGQETALRWAYLAGAAGSSRLSCGDEPSRPSPGTPVPGGRDHGAGRVSPSGDHTLGIRILDAPHPGAAGKER